MFIRHLEEFMTDKRTALCALETILPINASLKVDGNPAIIFGYDTQFGDDFFVATKKGYECGHVYKHVMDLAPLISSGKEDLAIKLSDALKYLPEIMPDRNRMYHADILIASLPIKNVKIVTPNVCGYIIENTEDVMSIAIHSESSRTDYLGTKYWHHYKGTAEDISTVNVIDCKIRPFPMKHEVYKELKQAINAVFDKPAIEEVRPVIMNTVQKYFLSDEYDSKVCFNDLIEMGKFKSRTEKYCVDNLEFLSHWFYLMKYIISWKNEYLEQNIDKMNSVLPTVNIHEGIVFTDYKNDVTVKLVNRKEFTKRNREKNNG